MLLRGTKVLLLGTLIAGLFYLLPTVTAEAKRAPGCYPQRPQRFLMRGAYVRKGMLDSKAHERAVKYRVKHYGSIPGIGVTEWNEERVSAQVKSTSFFGLPIKMHQKVVPALGCVEQRIRQKCSGPKSRYEPKTIGGLRTENTIRQGELSNHLFGIAIDIDPNENPCCYCVKKWQSNPRCAKPAKSPYDRADLTKCWVDAFEHYGFYWLGLDQLEDTMHFEFLGNPEKIR